MTGGLSSVSSGCRAVALPGLSALLALESYVSPEQQCSLSQPMQDLEREAFAGSHMASQHREGLHCLPTFDSKPAQSSHHHTRETAWEMQHLFLCKKKFHDLSRRKSRDLIIRQIQAELHAWKGAGSPPPTAHLPPFQRSLNHNPGRVGRTEQVLAHSQERSAYLGRQEHTVGGGIVPTKTATGSD